ncbi:uncharacterized protein LOC142769000 [Rhipicephalus microplus]|uniref:uncharacterized protein LOC142769000 n=1 Tax=Rhipicephalus microplus TaxID=6941 RepID=UPI003F6C998F
MAYSYINRICLVLPVLFQQYPSSAHPKSSACLQTPTVEGCSLIRRMWSFISTSGECEQNFVCSNHTNAFRDKASCMAACPSVPTPLPPESHKDCNYWILRLEQCKQTWMTFFWSVWGRRERVFIYTGCGRSPRRMYVYYVERHRCEEISLHGGRGNA